jgi:hypothetical protein
MFKKYIQVGLIVLSTVSCVHVQSVSLTQIPEKRTNKVSASTEKWIFFALNFDNDYVDKLAEDIKGKCSDGRVQGILTKDEVTNYFVGLVLKRTVTAMGYCNKA